MDKLFVVYETFIKVYTYPKAVEIQKIEIQQLKIDNAIKIWGNNLFNNYIFILSKLGQLAIGQFTNRFYLRQIIQFENTNIDISIVATDKIIISQQNNDNSIEVSLYNIVNEKIIKQYPLDLHNYTITNYILQKDYLNGLIGIEAHLDKQNALLLYGFTKQKRDQLQKIIYLEKDYDSISICSNKNQTQILQTQTQSPNLTIFYVENGYIYISISVDTKYQTNQFSQNFPITYVGYNFSNQNSIFYAMDFKTLIPPLEIIQVLDPAPAGTGDWHPLTVPKWDCEFIEYDTHFLNMTKDDFYIQLETRVKNYELIDFGTQSKCKQVTKYDRILCLGDNLLSYHKCKQVTKYDRILCLGDNLLSYHKYNGDIIQQLEFYASYSDNLTINIDNSNAIVYQDIGLSLINISQDYIYLYQNRVPIFINVSLIIYYKNWLINYENNQLKFYYIINDEYWDLQQQYQLNISDIYRFDYHPQSESIYYTQYSNSLLSMIECSLESETLNIGQIKTYDIQEHLYNYQIYTTDLKLNYLKIFDNNIVISSNYGHIYTFVIDKLKLINLHLITGPSAYVKDIYIFDKYLIMKGEVLLVLYKNEYDWSINDPKLSLESIYNSNNINLVALYKDNNNVVNILFTDKWGFVKAIIDDRFLLKFSDLSHLAPFYIVASNPYSSAQVLVIPIIHDNSSNIWTLVAIVGLILIIVWYICKKKNQTQDRLLN